MQIKVKKFPVFDNVHQDYHEIYIDETYAGNFWKSSSTDKQYLVNSIKRKAEVVNAKTAKKAKEYIISCYGN